MSFRIVLLAAIFCLIAQASPVHADKAILILDGSGSMWGQIDGRNKIEIARETVSQLMADWPPDTELGLIAYGHREKANCGDIETLVPVGSGTAAAVEAAVGDLNPKGKTPITAAVRQAAEELRSTEAKATVILVSDGLETCNADPCAAASELEAAGVDFTVHVVGFGTTAEENQQLQCLADNTGGKFLEASNAGELMSAMAEVKKEVAQPPTKVVKVKAATGTLRIINTNDTQIVYDVSGKQRIGNSPYALANEPLELMAGRYSLKANGTGITTVEQFEIKPGQELILDFGG